MPARQFQQLGLLGLLSPKEAGQPLMLAIDSIDEDPAQPRREFDDESLRELADTIALRGVRQPISVRPHPEQAKRWILNTGARRLRASRLAGKKEIPAFVDTTSDGYDQVIENEQREALKPMELALFVQRRMQAGDSQAEIARRLGKSRQYITYATALIDAPDWLLSAYREGRCKGLTALYELRKLHDEHAEQVEAWAARQEAMSREAIATLRSELEAAYTPSEALGTKSVEATALSDAPLPDIPPTPVREANTSPAVAEPVTKALPAADAPSRKAARLAVQLNGRILELVVDKDPGRPGEIFVRGPESGSLSSVSAADVILLGFVRG
jgi:ParB family chromosome partitioning protein